MKKFISFALAASMVISMVPATAFAASDLTTSHSNIRVTSDTEFYPETVEGETKRDIPYIRIEAKSDFVSSNQTFELVLENAEWLEDKDNSDRLYMEMEEHIAKEITLKKADGSSSTTTPTTPTKPMGELEVAYQKAAQDVKTAADAYIKALGTNVKAEQDAFNSASDKLYGDDTIVGSLKYAEKYKNELAEKQSASDNIEKLKADYEKALSDADNKAYKDNQAIINAGAPSAVVDPSKDEEKYKVSSGEFVYWVKSDNSTISDTYTPEGATTPITATTIEQKKDLLAGVSGAKLNNAYDTAFDEYSDYLKEKQAFDAATKANADINKALERTKKALEDAGARVTDKGSVDTSLVKDNLDKAQAAYDAAQEETDKVQKEYDDAKTALDKALEDAKADRTELDKALAARKTAAQEFIKGYGSDAVEAIKGIDLGKKSGDEGLFGSVDNSYKTEYKNLGIGGFTLADGAAVAAAFDNISNSDLTVDITKKSDTRIIVETSNYTFKDGDILEIPMFIRTTGGVAKVSIDSLDSEFTSEGRTFARTADGDTNLSIEKVQNFYDDDEIKNIYIEELVAGTLEPGKYVSLRVNGDFLLKADKNTGVTVSKIAGDGLSDTLEVYKKNGNGDYVSFNPGDDADEIYIRVEGSKSVKAVQYRIQGLHILEDGADFSEEATLTISGGGATKQTITVGNYEDYGVSFKAEDKELPVFYAGTRANSKFDNQTLKVTIEETVANSFIGNRKMEITLPDGVEFVNDNDDVKTKLSDIDEVVEDFKTSNFQGGDAAVKRAFEIKDDGSKITINGKDLPEATGGTNNSNKDRRRKIEFSVHVSAAADFTGDVVMTLGGAGVGDKELTATVATVKAPIEIKTSVNELMIDYRNTDIADITLVEPEAGLWAKDDVIYLEGERMSFENGAKAEVVSGDMKLDKLDGDYVETQTETDYKDDEDVLSVKVSSRSSKTPAEIKISGLSLYMNRSLAAGDYKLKVFGDTKNEFFMNNYHEDGDDYANSFETRKVTVMNDFVKVVTAGRDQDDSTFTTSIVVPVGSTTIQSGTRTINLAEMQGGACPAAYINNDGYTMLPVRAVIEALNGVAVVRWDDSTKTCTVSFGQRVFSMTVGSKVLNMNGVSTALNAAPEIRDSRVFLPLRDLGYALGLSESQISWDAATQTARLN